MNRVLRLGTVVGLTLSLAVEPLPLLAGSRLTAEAPAVHADLLLARGGGGGGRGGGGRGGGGGRSYGRSSGGGRSSSSGRTGFGNYSNGGSAFRGSSKPAGGFSSGSKKGGTTGSRQFQGGQEASLTRRQNTSSRQQGRQDLAGDRQGQRTDQRSDRQGQRADQRGDRQGERTDRTEIRQENRTDRSRNRQDERSDRVSDRTDLRRDRSDNRWDNYWSGWARPGWGYARPWNYGWYGGWSSPPWGWWGASAAAWGVTALTTAAIIDSAVDDAIADQVTYIAVPNTSYELYYPSVEPAGSQGVTFVVNTDTGTVEMTADCEQGTLDGRAPRTAQEAELLNAACVVAYGD
ncbi:MAG: hypothetical protein MUD04_04740 [Cyanobium sp. Prado107]|jgi:hypothetical protein|nr:hypothetical protein [Cyanobium sp. Prado107]